jgi:hypothetical protein
MNPNRAPTTAMGITAPFTLFRKNKSRTHRSLSNPFFLLCSLFAALNVLLVPTASYSYDELGLLGAANNWLHYGVPLIFTSKFGIEVPILGVLAEAFSHALFLTHTMAGIAAIHIAYKLPLIVANLLTAYALVRLGRRFGLQRPNLLAFVWLFNPVAFWVAAGHGQIEPLSVCAAVVSLELVFNGQFIAAGLVCGVGTGIEYIPLVVVASVLFLALNGRIGLRYLFQFCVATISGLVLSFGPTLLSGSGLSGLKGAVTKGIISSTTVGQAPDGLSFWNLWSHPENPSFWMLFAIVLLCILVVFLLGTVSNSAGNASVERVSCCIAGVFLVLIVLLDPVSQAQYALIASGGMLLLVIGVGLASWIATAVPLAGLLTYLLVESPWVFFLDITRGSGASSPSFSLPTSTLAATITAHVFTVCSIFVLLWAGAALLIRCHDEDVDVKFGRIWQPLRVSKFFRKAWKNSGREFRASRAICFGIVSCLVLALLGAQTQFWEKLGPGGVSQPFDLNGNVVAPGQVLTKSDTTITVHYSKSFLTWVSSGFVMPSSIVTMSAAASIPEKEHSNPSLVLNSTSKQIEVTKPKLQNVSAYWLRMLVYTPALDKSFTGIRNSVLFDVNGDFLRPTNMVVTSPKWSSVNLFLPSKLWHKENVLVVTAIKGVTGWAADKYTSEPRIVSPASFALPSMNTEVPHLALVPAAGYVSLKLNQKWIRVGLRSSVLGIYPVSETLFGLPLVPKVVIRLSRLPFGVSGLPGASMSFDADAPLRFTGELVIIGILWFVFLCILTASLFRNLQPRRALVS